MARIVTQAEEDAFDMDFYAGIAYDIDNEDTTNAVCDATCTTANDLKAKAIIVVTKYGHTARRMSKFRPFVPIVAATHVEKTYHQMGMNWGVYPVLAQPQKNSDDLLRHSIDCAKQIDMVENGDLVVITAGVPLGVSGTTNLLKVQLVGDVLVSGDGVNKGVACGNLCVCRDVEQAQAEFKEGDILVLPATDNTALSLMKASSGIITELGGMNSHAAIVGLALDKPVIVGAEHATQLLKSGTTVTLDASRGIVYGGVEKHTLG